MKKLKDNKLRIMVYGAESLGYAVPKTPVENSNFILTFCPINTEEEFPDFDGVIFFEKTFEEESRDKVICTNKAEMLKRAKQVFKLIDNGGFVCSLFYYIKDEYITGGGYTAYTHSSDDTNLAKVILNDLGIKKECRKSSDTPLKHFKKFRNEYIPYLDRYGVCQTVFELLYGKPVKPICKSRNVFTGMIVHDSFFFLPCLTSDSDKDEKNTINLFSTVAKALVETRSKLSKEIPLWINEQITFPEEEKLLNVLKNHEKEISSLKLNIKNYLTLKGCLSLSGETLVENVAFALETFFGLKTKTVDESAEDSKLFLQADGFEKLIAIAEIKGVNSGVKREHINQVDSHRERLNLPGDFPALLIINTKMDATDLKDKDLEIASDQIKKAVSDNVLIIRTLDLLNLIYLVEKGIVSKDKIIDIIQNRKGWLKATTESFEIVES